MLRSQLKSMQKELHILPQVIISQLFNINSIQFQLAGLHIQYFHFSLNPNLTRIQGDNTTGTF